MQLTGKTAIVTGSTSGIGLGIARGLAQAGANVVLNSFTNSDADHALAQSLATLFPMSKRTCPMPNSVVH
jgi:3-hydroxybutyrate dehydrogenase